MSGEVEIGLPSPRTRHANFVAYLQYFIDGLAPPPATIEGFRKILIEHMGTSGMLMDDLRKFVRAETRRLNLERSAAREQFWRLAREVGYEQADTIWRAAGECRKINEVTKSLWDSLITPVYPRNEN